MNQRFRPEPEASAELEDAALWYDRKRAGLGIEFVHAVDAALEQIAEWPQIGRLVSGVPDDVPARRWPVSRFPYHVIYLEWDGLIRILAFAHDSREPGFWFSRIRSQFVSPTTAHHLRTGRGYRSSNGNRAGPFVRCMRMLCGFI